MRVVEATLSVFLRVAKILTYIISGFVILLIIVALLAQTPYVRNLLKSYLVSTLATGIRGSLHIGDIEGSLIGGFSIDSIAIYQGSTEGVPGAAPTLTIDRITCYYEPLQFFYNTIAVNSLVIDRPRLRAVKTTGGWNFTSLFDFKTTPDTADTAAQPLTVRVSDVQIRHGELEVADSTLDSADIVPGTFTNAPGFTLQGISATLAATVNPSGTDLSLRNVSWYSSSPEFVLEELGADFSITPEGVSAQGLVIRTSRSEVELDAYFGHPGFPDLGPIETFRDDSVSLAIEAASVDYRELRCFLPQVVRKEGLASLRLYAIGRFGNFNVRHLEVRTPNGHARVHGTLAKLNTPEELTLDVVIESGDVPLEGLARFIPAVPHELFEPETRSLIAGTFKGRPVDFSVDVDLAGAFGAVSLDGQLNLTTPVPEYCATLESERFIPAALFGGGDYASGRFRGEIDGEGFNLAELRAKLSLEVDDALVRQVPLESLELSGTIDLGRVEGDLVAAQGRMNGSIGFAGLIGDSTFALDSASFELSHIDLEHLTRDTTFRSDITATGQAKFAGSSLSDISLETSFHLYESFLRDRRWEDDSVIVVLDQTRTWNKILLVRSSVADVDVSGRFDLPVLVKTLERRIDNLSRTISAHVIPESLRATETPPLTAAPADAPDQPMDFSYRARVSDLQYIADIVNIGQFNAHGRIEGRYVSDGRESSLDLKGNLEEIFAGKIGSGALIRNLRMDVTVRHLADSTSLDALRLSGGGSFDYGYLAGTVFDRSTLTLRYGGPRGVFTGSTRVDSVMTINMRGETYLQPASYVFDLDSLIVAAGSYRWVNDQDVQFRVSAEGTRIMRGVMKRGAEQLAATGLFSGTGEIDGRLTAKRFDLSVLNVILPVPELKLPGFGFLGTAQAEFTLGGTPSAPIYTVSASSNDFILRKTWIGQLALEIDYRDRLLKLDLEDRADSVGMKPTLSIHGSIPVDLSLAGAEDRFPDTPQSLKVEADGFDLSVFDPLIAELNNIGGKLNCSVDVSGTPASPLYSGYLDISAMSFTFAPNNLQYVADGRLVADGGLLIPESFRISNGPTARPRGSMTVTGKLDIREYRLNSFDITARGDLLVLSNASRSAVPQMYGPLFIRSDSGGITMSGTPETPFISGKVYVTEALVVFPPTGKGGTFNGGRTLNYVQVNDTSAGYQAEERFLLPFYGEQPVDSAGEAIEPEAPPTFLEKLRFDVDVETRGKPAIRFVFSPMSDEILYAELNGAVSARNTTGKPEIFGTVEIVSPSYYKFYKRFDATGKLKFVGPWDDPELEIDAVYEGSRTVYTAADTSGEGESRRIQVLLEITGRRYEPTLKITLREETSSSGHFVDIPTTGESEKEMQSNAVAFILTGKFSDDLTSSDKSSIAGAAPASTGEMVGSTLASSLLTGVLDEYLRREFPFIRSVDVSYEAGSSPGTRVEVSASALRGYLRIGGKILSDVGSASVSYRASLGELFDEPAVRNLFFQIEQRIEDTTSGSDNTVEGRVYYRFSF